MRWPHFAGTRHRHEKPSKLRVGHRDRRNDLAHGLRAVAAFLRAARGNVARPVLHLPASGGFAPRRRSATGLLGPRRTASDEPLLSADGALLRSVPALEPVSAGDCSLLR